MQRCKYCNGELDTGFNCVKCGKSNQPKRTTTAQTDEIRQAEPLVMPKIAEVTRLVVVDHREDIKPFGRIIDKWGVKVNCELQDNNRTLKVFITD